MGFLRMWLAHFFLLRSNWIITLRFQGYSSKSSIDIFAWRVTWNYATVLSVNFSEYKMVFFSVGNNVFSFINENRLVDNDGFENDLYVLYFMINLSMKLSFNYFFICKISICETFYRKSKTHENIPGWYQ